MNPFTYQGAESVESALVSVAAQPAGRFLGGGTNLIDLMKTGVEHPQALVDVTRVPIRSRGGRGWEARSVAKRYGDPHFDF